MLPFVLSSSSFLFIKELRPLSNHAIRNPISSSKNSEKDNYLIAKQLKSDAKEELGFTNFKVKFLGIFAQNPD
jgi:hypothetical protein